MKGFLKLVTVALLTVMLSLTRGLVLRFKIPRLQLHAPVLAQSVRVSISLPTQARVARRSESDRTGQLIDIIPQRQMVVLRGTAAEYEIPVSDVQLVRFLNGAPAYRADGRPILRGGSDSAAGSPVDLGPLPLNGLNIQSSSRGTAQVVLSSNSPGIDSSRRLTYVVDEIRFDAQQGTMTIRATPY